MSRRVLHAHSGNTALKDALSSLLMTELMHPSEEVYLISSRLGNTPLIDNRLDSYSDLFPRINQRWIYLSDILFALKSKGSSVHVICDPMLPQTQSIIAELYEKIEIRRVYGHVQEGLFTNRMFVEGALQFSDQGVYISGDNVSIVSEPAEIQDQFHIARRYWGEAMKL